MRQTIFAGAAITLGLGGAFTPAVSPAQENQTQESQAKSWNLQGEELLRTSGTVVDVLCEVAGDCVENCGDGTRQLGVVTDEGTLLLASKNIQPLFTGASIDLLPYCDQKVEVDGLLTGHSGTKLYQIQLIRAAGEDEWQKTDQWTAAWDEEFSDVGGEGPWFRRDPRIQERLEAEGFLGLGPEADQAFIDSRKKQ